MRWFLERVVAMSLAFALANAPVVHAETMYVTASSLNVREQPTVSSSIVGTLPYNAQVETAIAYDGWFGLEGGGFVSASYLSENPGLSLCEKDGNVSDKYVSWVNQTLSILPDSLIVFFKDNGWHIYVTDTDIDDTVFGGKYGRVKGVTVWKEKKILIEDRDSAMDSPLHEFGHFFDFQNGGITDTVEYEAAYEAEQAVFHEAYGVTYHYDKREFFAGAFMAYVEDRERLASVCPQICSLLDSYLSGYFQQEQPQVQVKA